MVKRDVNFYKLSYYQQYNNVVQSHKSAYFVDHIFVLEILS